MESCSSFLRLYLKLHTNTSICTYIGNVRQTLRNDRCEIVHKFVHNEREICYAHKAQVSCFQKNITIVFQQWSVTHSKKLVPCPFHNSTTNCAQSKNNVANLITKLSIPVSGHSYSFPYCTLILTFTLSLAKCFVVLWHVKFFAVYYGPRTVWA